MELIIDKAFLENIYFIAEESENEIEQDFCIFLQKRVRNFVLITDISEEDLPTEMEANPLFKVLAGKAVRTEHRQDVLPALEAKEFYAEGSVFKLFCVSLSTPEKAQQLKEKYGYAYLTPENVGKEWELFYSEREDKKMIVVNDDNPTFAKYRFQNWQNPPQLFSHPLNSILIFDKYILAEKTNYSLSTNFEKLLRFLLKDYARNDGIKGYTEILIISEKLPDFKDTEGKKITDTTKVIEKTFSKIRDFIGNICFQKHTSKEKNQLFYQYFNLTIVQYDTQNNYSEFFTVEHDRFIITNHFYINSGSGFNFFKKNGEANHRTRVDFDFVFLPAHQAYTFSALSNLQHYLSLSSVRSYPANTLQTHRLFKEVVK